MFDACGLASVVLFVADVSVIFVFRIVFSVLSSSCILIFVVVFG